MTGKLQVVAILTRIKYRARCYRIVLQNKKKTFSRQEMILFILLSSTLYSILFFALMHLKLFAYLFFKGNFIKCYSSLAIPQGNQRNESKKGKKSTEKLIFLDEGWKFLLLT